MPAFLEHQVRIHRDSGLPEDDILNVFHTRSEDTPAVSMAAFHAALQTFYGAIDQHMADYITGLATVKSYDLALPAPRAPIGTDTLELAPVNGAMGLPAELAICCTLVGQGATVTGGGNLNLPIEHRRGRVYIGPLNADIHAAATNMPDVYADLVERNVIGNALAALANPNTAGAGTKLSVYSRTWHLGRPATSGGKPGGRGPKPAIEPHSLDESMSPVYEVRIDDAFDIQRRRGAKARSRAVYAVT